MSIFDGVASQPTSLRFLVPIIFWTIVVLLFVGAWFASRRSKKRGDTGPYVDDSHETDLHNPLDRGRW